MITRAFVIARLAAVAACLAAGTSVLAQGPIASRKGLTLDGAKLVASANPDTIPFMHREDVTLVMVSGTAPTQSPDRRLPEYRGMRCTPRGHDRTPRSHLTEVGGFYEHGYDYHLPA